MHQATDVVFNTATVLIGVAAFHAALSVLSLVAGLLLVVPSLVAGDVRSRAWQGRPRRELTGRRYVPPALWP